MGFYTKCALTTKCMCLDAGMHPILKLKFISLLLGLYIVCLHIWAACLAKRKKKKIDTFRKIFLWPIFLHLFYTEMSHTFSHHRLAGKLWCLSLAYSSYRQIKNRTSEKVGIDQELDAYLSEILLDIHMYLWTSKVHLKL